MKKTSIFSAFVVLTFIVITIVIIFDKPFKFENETKVVKEDKVDALRVEGTSGDAQLTIRNANEIYPPIKTLSFGHGSGHEIIIDCSTGKVTWESTPDQSSRLFWDSVVLSFPEVKKRIIEDYEREKLEGSK